MPVPTLITDLDAILANNSPPGTESAKGNIDNYLRSHAGFIKQLYSAAVAPVTVTIASSATPAIGAAASNNIIISGVVTITAFDTAAEGLLRFVTFSGALTLTHNATTLILPGAANITTTAGDVALFKSLGGGNWRCLFYQYATGMVVGGLLTTNGQVKFPATQNPSADVNALDDYEEQTWTPVITAGSGTLTTVSATGTYTKIGRLVAFYLTITITTNGTGATSIFATLPFTASVSGQGTGRENNISGKQLQAIISGTQANIMNYDNTYPAASGASILLSGTYFTA